MVLRVPGDPHASSGGIALRFPPERRTSSRVFLRVRKKGRTWGDFAGSARAGLRRMCGQKRAPISTPYSPMDGFAVANFSLPNFCSSPHTAKYEIGPRKFGKIFSRYRDWLVSRAPALVPATLAALPPTRAAPARACSRFVEQPCHASEFLGLCRHLAPRICVSSSKS